jgi:hypothetical protein
MDETDPIARAQHQLRDDLELVQRYGPQEAPEQFGGCYWDNEPPITIVARSRPRSTGTRPCCAGVSRTRIVS